jgi:hypothetical protein
MEQLEWQTRRCRINKRLQALSRLWTIISSRETGTTPLTCHAVEEYPTANGLADYALFVNSRFLGIIETQKKQNAPLKSLIILNIVTISPEIISITSHSPFSPRLFAVKVPKDPNAEPASQLLKRIQAKKPGCENKGRKKKIGQKAEKDSKGIGIG